MGWADVLSLAALVVFALVSLLILVARGKGKSGLESSTRGQS